MSDFLDDVLAEISHATQEKRAQKGADWKEPTASYWFDLPPVARFTPNVCPKCGEISHSPEGTFSRRQSPSGAIVETRIPSQQAEIAYFPPTAQLCHFCQENP